MDPDGKADIDSLYESIKKVWSSGRKKYPNFEEIQVIGTVSKTELDSMIESGYRNFVYRKTPGKNSTTYDIGKYTEFGKMSNSQKLETLEKEYLKLLNEYDSLCFDGKSTMTDLFCGLGESLFKIADTPNFEEFMMNFVFSNAENITDLLKFDLDGISCYRDLEYIKSLIEYYSDSSTGE